MAESFLGLSRKDQLEALGVAATASGRPAHVLEKDVWVVWTLDALFQSPFAAHLVFKGGTSLSKAYGVIDRFSEDIDITFDVGELVGDLATKAVDKGDEKLPPNTSQMKKWREAIETNLPEWVQTDMAPYLASCVTADHLTAEIRAEGDKIRIVHTPAASGWDYMSPDVVIEFGGRSTGMPVEHRALVCDAAEHLAELAFPTATARVMHVERTFWEKATAVHVFCKTEQLNAERLARHWYDLMRLDEAGHADTALANRELAEQVADHKAMFFRAKDVDYREAIAGGLVLVPEGDMLDRLRADYTAMQTGGLLNDSAPSFEAMISRCADLQGRARAAGTPEGADAPRP